MLLLAPAALAASLALPEGARAEDWAEAAQVGGLTLAGPGEAADAVCVVTARVWEVRVVGLDGRARTERIAVPADEAGRERVTRVAASLVATVEASSGGVRPVAPAATTTTPPSPSDAAAWDPAAVPITLAASGGAPARVRPWVGAAGSVLVRAALDTTGAGSLAAGVAVGDTFWAGAAVDLCGARAVTDGVGVLRGTDARVEASWLGPERVGLLIGVGGGASFRAWAVDDAVREREIVPVLTGEAGAGLRLGDAFVATLTARAGADLRPTEVSLDGDPWSLSPWQLGAGLTVRARLR